MIYNKVTEYKIKYMINNRYKYISRLYYYYYYYYYYLIKKIYINYLYLLYQKRKMKMILHNIKVYNIFKK